MKLADIRDKNIEDYDKSNLELSILFTEGGLSYSLMVRNEMRYVCLQTIAFNKNESYLEQCNQALEKIVDKVTDFYEIRFIVADNRQTIIPDALFEVSDSEKYWNLNFKNVNDCNIHHCHLAKSLTNIVFPVNCDLDNLLNSFKGKKSIIPSAASFIEFNYKRSRLFENPERPRLFVQVYESFVEILLIENFNIKLFNTFTFKSQNDLLYHIINVFEQLKITQKNTELILSGFLDTDSLSVLNLKKFVSEVYFESQNIGLRYYYQFQEIAPHYYFYLLNY